MSKLMSDDTVEITVGDLLMLQKVVEACPIRYRRTMDQCAGQEVVWQRQDDLAGQ